MLTSCQKTNYVLNESRARFLWWLLRYQNNFRVRVSVQFFLESNFSWHKGLLLRDFLCVCEDIHLIFMFSPSIIVLSFSSCVEFLEVLQSSRQIDIFSDALPDTLLFLGASFFPSRESSSYPTATLRKVCLQQITDKHAALPSSVCKRGVTSTSESTLHGSTETHDGVRVRIIRSFPRVRVLCPMRIGPKSMGPVTFAEQDLSCSEKKHEFS